MKMRRITLRLDTFLLVIVMVILVTVALSGLDVSYQRSNPPHPEPAATGNDEAPASSPHALVLAQPQNPNDVFMDETYPSVYDVTLKEASTVLHELLEESGGTPADISAFTASVEKMVNDFLAEVYKKTKMSSHHDRYILLRQYLSRKVALHRMEHAQREQGTDCAEFVRVVQQPSDALYRVPCVPWNTSNLLQIEWRKNGLLATFEHVAPPTLDDPPRARLESVLANPPPPLQIAVEMSGHMRTFRHCYRTTVKNLLLPNQALLFAVTYPDVGDKRFGVRFQDRDSPAPVNEIADMYSPYLAALYVLDVPTITRDLNGWFPQFFHLKQWSWMIYQLFTMDLAHNITLMHQRNETALRREVLRGDPPMLVKTLRQPVNPLKWTHFDVVVRVRPDLYILGDVWIRRVGPEDAVFNFSCGENVYTEPFTVHDVIRAPHHPTIEWFSDPLSDHSAVGFTQPITRFLQLFSEIRRMSLPKQDNVVFKHGNTAERMWGQHVDRLLLNVIPTWGWHIMLRNPAKYFNSTASVANTKRRKLFTEKVFGVTNASQVNCPDPAKKMVKLPKKPRLKKKVGTK